MLKKIFIYSLLVFYNFVEPFHLQPFKNKALLMCRSVRRLAMLCNSLPRDEQYYEACNEDIHCPSGKFCLYNVCEKGILNRKQIENTTVDQSGDQSGDQSVLTHISSLYTPSNNPHNTFEQNQLMQNPFLRILPNDVKEHINTRLDTQETLKKISNDFG